MKYILPFIISAKLRDKLNLGTHHTKSNMFYLQVHRVDPNNKSIQPVLVRLHQAVSKKVFKGFGKYVA